MKEGLRIWQIVVLIICLMKSFDTLAAPVPVGGGGQPPCFPPPCVPIDGGTIWMVVIGFIFAFLALYKFKIK